MSHHPAPSRKERLKRVPHFISAIIILLHAFERFETDHGNWWFFALSGAVFLGVAIFHHRLSVKYPRIDLVFFIVEGVLSATIGVEYVLAHKTFLPYVYFLAAVLQMAGIYFFYRKAKQHR